MSHKEQQRHKLVDLPYCTLWADIVEDVVFIHLDVREWSPGKYKEMRKYWRATLTSLKKRGFEDVFTHIYDKDPKQYKFQNLFGFKEFDRKKDTIIFYRST